MFILSSDIFSHLLLSSIYLTSTSFPFSLSGHPSSSLVIWVVVGCIFGCCFLVVGYFGVWLVLPWDAYDYDLLNGFSAKKIQILVFLRISNKYTSTVLFMVLETGFTRKPSNRILVGVKGLYQHLQVASSANDFVGNT